MTLTRRACDSDSTNMIQAHITVLLTVNDQFALLCKLNSTIDGNRIYYSTFAARMVSVF